MYPQAGQMSTSSPDALWRKERRYRTDGKNLPDAAGPFSPLPNEECPFPSSDQNKTEEVQSGHPRGWLSFLPKDRPWVLRGPRYPIPGR